MGKSLIVEYNVDNQGDNNSKDNYSMRIHNSRPSKISDYICDNSVIDNLNMFIHAAKSRNDTLDHVLLDGPPGLGKTTLAHIIANEMKSHLHTTSSVILTRPGDLASILTNISDGDVLFIDEIHRLNSVVEEYLYTAMEDFKIDILLNSGSNARSVAIKLHKFTLIGATTQPGLLTPPLLSRFGIRVNLNYYDVNNLSRIAKRTSKILNYNITNEAAVELAKRSRGTPRILNNLLRRLRDFAQVAGSDTINLKIVQDGLSTMKINENGLNENDIKILDCIVRKFSGGPVGLSNISMVCNIDERTIQEMYEPYLVHEGYIRRAQRGRIASPMAYRTLGLTI